MAKLYIVPTPVGNLEDITLRALNVLKSVDVIYAEDTRTSSVLLNRYEIKRPLRAYHKFNEHGVTASVVNMVKSGSDVALVSDAGTPGISDPGFLLVRACVEEGVEVETLPGATAFVPALINSGLACDKFCFEGFLPQKKGRNKIVTSLKEESRTMIFYESPHRVVKTLTLFNDIFEHNPTISVSREISKKFEQTIRGKAPELIEHFTATPPKGEFVIVVEGNNSKPSKDKNQEN